METTGKKIGINGEGIAYLDKLPVFVENLLPTETAEIELTFKTSSYAKAKVIKRLNDSPDRITPRCPIQQQCGGCPMMTMKAPAQLLAKRELVKEAMIKYARLPGSLVEPVRLSPELWGYRNQCKLAIHEVKRKLVSGLYEEGSNRLIEMERCFIHSDALEAMRKEVLRVLNRHKIEAYSAKTEKGLRTLMLRGFNGSFQCALVTGKNDIPAKCINDLASIEGLDCLMHNVNPKRKTHQVFSQRWNHLAGKETIQVDLETVKLELSCASFFQLNLLQSIRLYQMAEELLKPCRCLVEAYSGVGGISLMLQEKAQEIIGIESVESAVLNANENAKLNNLDHKVRFVCGDAAKEMKKLIKKRRVDAVVVDPPRSGLDEDMLECLKECKPKQIIYISCNPATLGKNIKELSGLYTVERIVPFDLFPQTAHVETIVSLVYCGPERKNNNAN